MPRDPGTGGRDGADGFGDQLALVEVEGVARRVNIGLLDEPPPPGQWVLIHMGFAVELTDASRRRRRRCRVSS